MTRRGFFGMLLAAVTGKLLPAPKPRLVEDVSIRIVHTGYATRLDMLYGFSRVRPEIMCRIVE